MLIHKQQYVGQIAYDVSGAGTLFRKTFGLTLGWWHCYKQANLLIWRFAGPHFLGPMFHMLVPRSKVKRNPKLLTVATYLSYVRLAYPKFRSKLAAALNHPGVTANNKRHLRNLQMLCEFFIPVVIKNSINHIIVNSFGKQLVNNFKKQETQYGISITALRRNTFGVMSQSNT